MERNTFGNVELYSRGESNFTFFHSIYSKDYQAIETKMVFYSLKRTALTY